MEKNYDQLKLALQQLPTYAIPDKNWEIVEHTLDIDVRSLPNTKIPKDIWAEIESELDKQLLQLPEIKIPIDIWNKIEADLDETTSKTLSIESVNNSTTVNKKSFLFKYKTVALAASMALIIGIGFMIMQNQNQETMLAFDGSKLQSMQFEDGSVLYSKQNAKINYPKKFSKNTREIIQTDGVAFYEITKNPERPFIIHSEIGTVRVLGTSFTTNVSTDSIQVIVKTGKVSVTTATDSILLLPTESIVYYADGRKPKMIDAVTQEAIEIENKNTEPKIISYSEIKLINILEELQQKYKVKISCNAKMIGDKKITGRFVDGDIDALLSAICEASGLSFVKNNQTYIIQ
jgi:transmembrane sensor